MYSAHVWQSDQHLINYTVSQKIPHLKYLYLFQILTDFQTFLYRWKAYEICYKTTDNTHLTLGMLHHYHFENWLRFDKVKESLKVGTFWNTVYTFLVLIHDSVITTFGVGFDI